MRYNLYMSKQDERKLQVIESAKTEVTTEPENKQVHQTNPIIKKFLKFHKENTEKFRVIDLFKK